MGVETEGVERGWGGALEEVRDKEPLEGVEVMK